MTRTCSIAVLLSIATVNISCGDPTTPADRPAAVVEFDETVKTAPLLEVGAEVLAVIQVPPQAIVRASEQALRKIERAPPVQYVIRFDHPLGDSVRVRITFRDRPEPFDPVTRADSQAVQTAGGRIILAYSESGVVDPDGVKAVIPIDALTALSTEPIITGIFVTVGGPQLN